MLKGGAHKRLLLENFTPIDNVLEQRSGDR